MLGYCYCRLSQKQKEIYRTIIQGVKNGQVSLTFRTSRNNVQKALEAVMLEAAELYTCALEMSQMAETADGCILLCFTYLCSKPTRRLVEMELNNKIQQIFETIGLAESQTDYEKAGKIHDYLMDVPLLPLSTTIPSWPLHLFETDQKDASDHPQNQHHRQPKSKYVYQLRSAPDSHSTFNTAQYGSTGACDWIPKFWKRRKTIAAQPPEQWTDCPDGQKTVRKVQMVFQSQPLIPALQEESAAIDCTASSCMFNPLPLNCYGPDLNSVLGVLLFHRATPLGLARAFQYLCYQAHVECLLCAGICQESAFISSTSHVWNLVRIDGDYYYADLMLDGLKIQPNQSNRSHFLVSKLKLPHHYQHTPGPTCSTACMDPALQQWLPASIKEEGRGEFFWKGKFQFVA